MVKRLKLYDKIVKLKKNGFVFAEKLEEEARVVVSAAVTAGVARAGNRGKQGYSQAEKEVAGHQLGEPRGTRSGQNGPRH